MTFTEKVLLAMSGGVDSSAAAKILQDSGYEVIGVTFDMLGDGEVLKEAKRTAEDLNISHFGFDFSKEFKESVIKNFADTYLEGKTPNPCIVCNEKVKFKYLYDLSLKFDCKYIATGHYAKLGCDNGRYYIKKAPTNKDQSYMLYRLNQHILSKLILPLGEFEKNEVRSIAKSSGISSAEKSDSQDICFVPDGDYVGYLCSKCNVKCKEGDFVTADGEILGKHKGIIHYTVGQRKGLGLALPRPMYVTEKDTDKNEVVLGYSEDLFKDKVTVKDIVMMKYPALKEGMKLKVKLRYSQKEAEATVTLIDDGCELNFTEPQRAPAKGQSAVFYEDDGIIGGGIIER